MDETPTPTQEGEQIANEAPQPTPVPTPQPQVSPEPQLAQAQASTPPQPPDAPAKKNPVLWIAIVLFILALLAGGVYVALNKGLLTKQKACTQDAKVCPDGTSVGRVGPKCEFAPCPTPTATPDPTAGWQTYLNNEIGFSIKYPSDLEPKEDEVSKIVTFVKFGPTQKEGTEFYDGISMSIKTGNLGGKTLKEFADSVAKGDPTSVVVSGPEMVYIAGISAYKLTIRGLGEFDYYYFQKGADGYIEIVDNSQDPAEQGFIEIVTQMLESLKILVTSVSPSPSPTP